MKKILIAFAVTIAIGLFAFFMFQIHIENFTLNIHFHDTYYVIRNWYYLCFIALLFVFSLTLAILHRLNKSLFNWLFIISIGILLFALRNIIKNKGK